MPYICLLQEGNSSLPRLIERAQQNNYGAVAVPLNVMEIPIDFQNKESRTQSQFTYGDLVLSPEQWNNKVIGILSENIDCDSKDPIVRRHSEDIVKRDKSWAEHLQWGGHTLIKLKQLNNVNLARLVTNQIKGNLLVQVPLYNAYVASASWRRDIDEDKLMELEKKHDTWQWWHQFRSAADFNAKLKVVLEFHEDERPHLSIIRRWLGEPLEAVIISKSLFVSNGYGFPVLRKAWQEILKLFLLCRVNIIMATSVEDHNLKLYNDYLQNFTETHKDSHLLEASEDILEVPLQPLYDNLDCYTYEVFEKDPVKYKLYQDAITAALIDRVGDSEINQKIVVIMVLGAGRGPLVRSALNAAKNTKRKVRIYIVEKNPNAIRTLTAVVAKLWSSKDVHLICEDMRTYSPPEKADILVSELLGSFGDNELSPECLDCAQHLLKSDGISIPYKSVSYINPVMSTKLHNAVRQLERTEIVGRDKSTTYSESGFVVLLKNIYNIDYPQALFEFTYPNRQNNDEYTTDNSRYKVLKFQVELDCVLTGIAGYFECYLYRDIIMSINPQTQTMGMLSWFPMYFPFSEPINLKKGQTIEIHFWRCISKRMIWTMLYEIQCGETFATTWLANNRQQLKKFCEKHDINQINIPDVCNKITAKFNFTLKRNNTKRLQSTSETRNPFYDNENEERYMPFHIISKLCLGAVQIFQKQVDHLLELTTNLLEASKKQILKAPASTFTSRKRKSTIKRKIIRTTINYVQTTNEYDLVWDNDNYEFYCGDYLNVDDSLSINTKLYSPQQKEDTQNRDVAIQKINAKINKVNYEADRYCVNYIHEDDNDVDDGFGNATEEELAQFFNFFPEKHDSPSYMATPFIRNSTKRKSDDLDENICLPLKQMYIHNDNEYKLPPYDNGRTIEMSNVQTDNNSHLLNDIHHQESGENMQEQLTSMILSKRNCNECLNNTVMVKKEEEEEEDEYDPEQVLDIQSVSNEATNIINDEAQQQGGIRLAVDDCTTIAKQIIDENIRKFNANWPLRTRKPFRIQFKKKLHKKKITSSTVELLNTLNRRITKMKLNFHNKFTLSQQQFRDNFLMLIRGIFVIDNPEQNAKEIYPKWLNYSNVKQPRITQRLFWQTDQSDNINNTTSNLNIDNIDNVEHHYEEYQPYGIMMKLLHTWRQSAYNEIDANVFCNAAPTKVERALTFSSMLNLIRMNLIAVTKVENTIKIDKIILGKESKKLICNYIRNSNT